MSPRHHTPGMGPHGSLREKRGLQAEVRGSYMCGLGGVPMSGTSSPLRMQPWIQVLALLLLSCVTLGRSLNLSGPLDREWC